MITTLALNITQELIDECYNRVHRKNQPASTNCVISIAARESIKNRGINSTVSSARGKVYIDSPLMIGFDRVSSVYNEKIRNIINSFDNKENIEPQTMLVHFE